MFQKVIQSLKRHGTISTNGVQLCLITLTPIVDLGEGWRNGSVYMSIFKLPQSGNKKYMFHSDK